MNPIRFNSVQIILLVLVSLSFIHCDQKKNLDPVDQGFTQYVEAYTSGVVSNQSSIKIRLMEPYKKANVGEVIERKLFKISPNIEGEAIWSDQQTIIFNPTEILPQGKVFKVSFYLSELMEVPEKLKQMDFQFQVMNQAIEINFEGMEAPDPNKMEEQELHGYLMTYDKAIAEDVESAVSAMQNGKVLPLVWEHESGKKVHKFIIEQIERGKEKGEVTLKWNGEALGFDGAAEEQMEIPPLGEFKVHFVSTSRTDEQYLTVYFSDPISQKQDIEGLIYLKSGTDVKLVKELNSIKVYPVSRINGDVTLVVSDGLKNVKGYQLIKALERKLTFTSIKPGLELVGKGNILPSSDGLIFPFKAVNLNAVDVKVVQIFENSIAQFFQTNQYNGTDELKRVGRLVYKGEIPLKSDKPINYANWNTFSIDLSTLIETAPGSIYRVHLSFNKKHSLYPCEGEESEELVIVNYGVDNDEAYFDDPNGWYYYEDSFYNYRNYKYQDREDPCKLSYYMMSNRSVSRNILASDMGIIAKGGQNGKLLIAVTNLKSTQAMSQVTLDLYNFQQQKIGTVQTNSEGIAEIDLIKKPFLLIAKKGSQKSYLRLDDGNALSMSMFDIGGQKLQEGIKGMLYGERGVWRPGDSLYLTFKLEDKFKALPEEHPVVFELYTPQQQLYKKIVRTKGLNGFYDFRTTTDKDATTGNWLAKVKLGGSVFSKSIKIEAVKPNRLKINLDFKTPILTDLRKPEGELEIKWLHGATGSGLKAAIEMSLRKGTTSFDQFREYTFDDPSKDFNAEDKIIFEDQVDANGMAKVRPEITVQKNAPGMLQAYFKLRAFEKGGDFSVSSMHIPYSPYRGYVGVKVPEGKGWNGALYSNEPNIIPIVTVDEEGNPVDREKVRIEIFDVYWRWWWEKSDDNELSRYIANSKKNRIASATINTVNGKAIYELNLGGQNYGRKFIRITDPVTGHSTGQTFYTTYKGWWNNSGGSSPGGAEMLTFSTDKKKYEIGENIQVTIPGAQQGNMLVTLESGANVLKYFWVQLTEDNQRIEIPVTKEMAPNIYVNLTLIQPHKNVKNDLPIRLYGVQSVSVEDAESHLEPLVEMPDVLTPEQEFEVKVREGKGRKMTYTLAVVDDGLLDLTRFKTPDLWSHFYAKEALSVRTWDLYKYVIGSFSGEMAGLLALGGDEYLTNKGGAKANRFVPVVQFLGPFELEANQSTTHKISMPNYVGSVRTMVVAGDASSYGFAEKTSLVKKPLMVLATLPRVVGPGEQVKLPVTVFAMDKKVKEVTVDVQSNIMLHVEGANRKVLNFEKEGDKVVNFDLKVGDKLGVGKVTVVVKSGIEKATYEVELDVRPSNPRVTDVIGAIIEPGASWTNNYKAIGMDGTNSGVVELSTFPAINLKERMDYLIRYPHGCIEQTTSAVFPQLFLNNFLELSSGEKRDIDSNIKEGINRIRKFQVYSGGLTYWPGTSTVASDWGTSYAGHFMLEAKAKGYSLPPGFISDWIKFQKQRANSWTEDMEHSYGGSSQLIQAYRLYTLALAKSPVLGAMNRLRSVKKLSLAARWRLAAAYELIGKTSIANDMINNQPMAVKTYRELSYSYGSSERDDAMILETLTLLNRKRDAKVQLDKLAKILASDKWLSTQTTAYSLLAISKFIGDGKEGNKQMKFEYSINKGTVTKSAPMKPFTQVPLEFGAADGNSISIQNTGDNSLFLKQQLEGIPLIGDQTNANSNLKMKVRYTDLDGRIIDPTLLKQGTDFMAEIELLHPGLRSDYKEMALVQIFPSGWEIRNSRMDMVTLNIRTSIPTYQDIRDDRVLTYFDLERTSKKTFKILLNAAYLGEFYLPTVYCEAMYDNEVNARQAGKWVKVVSE